MSLINDALKRATQSPTASATSPAPEPRNPMQPVDYRRGKLPWFFFPCLFFILAGACWFIVIGLEASRFPSNPMKVHAREPISNPEPTSTTTATAPSDGVSPSELLAAGISAPPPDTVPTQFPNRNFSLEDAPAAPAASAEATALTTAPESSKPAYKLQGIFYRPSRPSAVVNAQTVYIGDTVSGGKVKSIQRDRVTLLVEGETKVLTLR